MTQYYTGVGSRELPESVGCGIFDLAGALAPFYTLRSGAAKGSDTAFETGALHVNGAVAVYLPWKLFNQHDSLEVVVCDAALALAKTVHPAWDELNSGERKLHARNCYQVLGRTLRQPSDFLVCWTPDGCESARTRRKGTGGTATAIVLAEAYRVPVFNLKNDASRVRLREYLESKGITPPESLTHGLQQTLF